MCATKVLLKYANQNNTEKRKRLLKKLREENLIISRRFICCLSMVRLYCKRVKDTRAKGKVEGVDIVIVLNRLMYRKLFSV